MSDGDTKSPVDAEPVVTIEKLVYGGDGLGRMVSGEVVFVPWSAPGDEAELLLNYESKPLKGHIGSLLKSSDLREKPPCSVFGECGGCHWQHIQPVHQRDWKGKIVEESLSRLGKLSGFNLLPTIPGGDGGGESGQGNAWHYRNRVQWEIDTASDDLGAQDFRLGYYASGSHDVVEFDHCWIIPEALNDLANCIRKFVRENPSVSSALLRIEAFINRENEVFLTVEGELHARLNSLIKSITSECANIVGVAHQEKVRGRTRVRHLSGQDHLMQTLGGKSFRVSAGSFFQTNFDAAELILKTIDEWLIPDADTLLDIYAGVGTFSVCLKDRARRIVAVEASPSAIVDAQENAKANDADIEVRAGDARKILTPDKDEFDVAIIDPPRGGCQPELIAWLATHVQKQILYVSCNPTTLARDLRLLVDQGWQIEAVQPIDMFPQTYHVETVVNLRRVASDES